MRSPFSNFQQTQRYVFKSRLKLQTRRPDHEKKSDSEFQTVRVAIEKARRCQMCCDGTAEYLVCDGLPTGNVMLSDVDS